MFNIQFHPEQVHPSVWIAPGAVVVGDVTLEENVSIWFQSVLRGDTESLTIQANTNIQEGCILHADPGFPLFIGKGVTIGHGAVIHGAKVGDNALIGIRSVLLNGVVVGENSIVGACALLTQNKIYPPNSLILGAPAKAIRELTPEEVEQNRHSAAEYVRKSQAFKQQKAP